MADTANPPRWREDFPIRWDDDHYVTRRELAKFLTLGSGLLAGANVLIALVGLTGRAPEAPERRIAVAGSIAPGTSLVFRYPTDEDPCILVRDDDGTFRAYSQVCTHLSCAVIYRANEQVLHCPCHKGLFAVADGRPVAGPPTRRLPRIRLEQRGGDLFATGVEI
ncbi:MAG: ubiquinol-cytochrome c reductase iron-sulfur subunit [Betaproteobacteria bacterium]